MLIIGVLFTVALLAACRNGAPGPKGANGVPAIKSDFSTPEGAILVLEQAYRDKDLEASVQSKDFFIEARLMLEQFKNLPKEHIDSELVRKTAEVLELSYRKEIEQKGFPDMTSVESSFPKRESYQDNIVIVTEVCHYPDGATSRQRLLVAKTDKGWRVLNPID